MGRRLRLLFLSTGSACRALLAQAWARAIAGDALDLESSALDGTLPPGLPDQILRDSGLGPQVLAYRPFGSEVVDRADLVVLLGEWGDHRSVALANGAGRIDWHLPVAQGMDRLENLRLTREVLRHKVAGLLAELGIRPRADAAHACAALAGTPVQPPAACRTASAI